jgi:hypothetical protein
VALVVSCTNTPSTPQVDTVGTMVAATLQSMTLQAPTAIPTSLPTLTPILLPTVIPTPTIAPAVRIHFDPNATYWTIDGSLPANQSQTYVFNAGQYQPVLVNVDSLNQQFTFSLTGNDGTVLVSEAQRYISYQGLLPSTQDYYLKINAGAAGGSYTLGLTIASRIQFQAGATSATLTGSTVNGWPVTYVARAAAGQTMKINLSVPAGTAALTIWGFSDGQPYQRAVSESTTFNMVLPSTQDYIIEVVPQAGTVVNYSMSVVIK